MKASLTWMNEYVPVDSSRPAEELAERLTKAGIPVEEVQSMDAGIKKVYTGKIVEITPHPDADKLVVCQIECLTEDGEPVTKQIVTGATNVRVGQIVPVAYHKSKLPGGKEIKKGKLRGVVSEGMLCSVAELGISKDLVLPEEANGIYILPADTPIGQDIKDVLMLNDTVYEFELTPNRADCFSMLGLAREFAVMEGKSYQAPTVTVSEGTESIEGQAHVSIEATDLCERFTARIVKNVTVGPSPLWMQNKLRNSGIRPINTIVDVTNYVMLELGQPMHAYDYDCVAGHQLTARLAKSGEKLVTLDETERELTEQMLVIADANGPVGVAGVMGGLASEVTANTKHVLLEAAVFNGASIRRTARALGMRSEASGRFERGVNAQLTRMAMDRAVQLLQGICPGCEVLAGVLDVGQGDQPNRTMTCDATAINAYLGTAIAAEEMVRILKGLDFGVTVDGDTLSLVIPSWRGDVTGMPDIAEEVARIYGYDNIPATTPWEALTSGTRSARKNLVRTVAHYLAGAGMSEAITFSFMHTDSLQRLLLPETDKRYQAVPILNPISEEFPYMRTTLVPSLLEAAGRNVAQKNQDLWMFETAAVYEPAAVPVTELPTEHWMAAGVLLGNACDTQWCQAARTTDFYDVKGIMEGLLATVGIQNAALERASEPYFHPGVSATYSVDGSVLATFGKLHPQVVKQYDLPENSFVFEIDLDVMLASMKEDVQYVPVSRFPGITRDLAIVAPKTVPAAAIERILVEHGGEMLERAVLFDVYEGTHIQDGYASLAYSLSFRSQTGTLQDSDIEGPIEAILTQLRELGCELR